MAKCDYNKCSQNRNGKCGAPGYRECLRAKAEMKKSMTTIGEIVGVDETSIPNTYYVFGKKKAKKAKEQYPNLTVMYRNAKTKGFWVEYKGELTMNELYTDKLLFDLHCPRPIKMIKAKPDFYNYLMALHKDNVYFVNDNPVLTYIMGIPIVVDNTILSDYYELEF